MKRGIALVSMVALCVPFIVRAATVSVATATSVVMIANYDDNDEFLGWGTGFFVDDGIVVTNKHVIEDGSWYRVIATDTSGNVNFDCDKHVTKSDVKINLDDDVAYMRVFLPCDHGSLVFAGADPQSGDPVVILGYPYRGSIKDSLSLFESEGTVKGETADGWIATDAFLDVGNSGGPVTNGTDVIGVAVAKGVDENGNFLRGYFIPQSVILNGLLYANDSRFGYTPHVRSSSSSSSRISSVSSVRTSSSSASSRTTRATLFQERTCARVQKWLSKSPLTKARVNERLQRRFGFMCR